MQLLISIIFFTFTFSSIHPINEKIKFSLDEKVDSLNINLRPMLYSAILPGSGEYSMGYSNCFIYSTLRNGLGTFIQ